MKKTKNYTLLALFIPFALAIGCEYAIHQSIIEAKPVAIEYFKTGDILPPESPCGGDTLIVVDANGLNKAIVYYEQGLREYTNVQLDSIFNQYCTVK